MRPLTQAQVKKHNGDTVRFLAQKLTKLPATVLARLSNATIRAAVENTYQDSGRFNWNWRVQWGSTDLGEGGQEYGVPPVGLKGDARKKGHEFIIKELRDTVIGFSLSGLEQGTMARAIIADDPTQVRIFNPYYKGLYGEYAAEGKLGTSDKTKNAAKVKIAAKIEEAITREANRAKHELRYKGSRE